MFYRVYVTKYLNGIHQSRMTHEYETFDEFQRSLDDHLAKGGTVLDSIWNSVLIRMDVRSE